MKSDVTAFAPVKRSIRGRAASMAAYEPYTPLDAAEIVRVGHDLADHIEKNLEALTDILLLYESFEVVQDEIARALDLLRNLHENKKYFRLRIGEVASFLPRNQPLYAFTCFVVVPSLMASKVYFRIPHSMRHFFPKMLSLLAIQRIFPNVIVSRDTRLEFLRNRSALRINPASDDSTPITDAVIFTGTSAHAEQVRHVFDHRTLVISNGSGHNPLVVAPDADLNHAVDAVLTLQLYNQGQDCAAPNAILVHKNIYSSFLTELRKKLNLVRVGPYRDRTCRVGPISDPADLVRISDLLVDNRDYLDPTTSGRVRIADGIIEPTIICKPLNEGGNFSEIFAPIIFLQKYDSDDELSTYFEDPKYAPNAMYVTVYGSSVFIDRLKGRLIGGKVLHNEATIIRNTHLHEKGVERGTQQYGGYGTYASSIAIGGKVYAKPTLPQRDIYEWIEKPLLHKSSSASFLKNLNAYSKIRRKNVEKLLRIISRTPAQQVEQVYTIYVDSQSLKRKTRKRFIRIDPKHTYHMLTAMNIKYIVGLNSAEFDQIRSLRKLLRLRATLPLAEFTTRLYAIPTHQGGPARENRTRQLRFFEHIYQLLLGKSFGPRLPQFLREADMRLLLKLLDI